MRAAVESGITFFDTADTYSQGASEIITGRLLGKLLARDEFVLATKVFMPMTPGENGGGLSRKHILAAIDASLQRLEIDYVDLYQIHRWDNRTPIEETMEALHDVVRAGKARYIGASSHVRLAVRQGAARRRAARAAAVRLDAEPLQPRLPRGGARDDPPVHRPGRRGDPLEPARSRPARRQPHPRRRAPHDALGLDPFTTISTRQPTDFDVVDRVAEVAGERGVPPAQVALAWLLHKPGVTAPIVGATKLEHLSDALAAEQLDAFRARRSRRLEEPYRPHPVLGHG